MSMFRVLLLSVALALPAKAVVAENILGAILGGVYESQIRRTLTVAGFIGIHNTVNDPLAAPVRQVFGRSVLFFHYSGRYTAVNFEQFVGRQNAIGAALAARGIRREHNQDYEIVHRQSLVFHNTVEEVLRPIAHRTGTWRVRGGDLCFDNRPCWRVERIIDWGRGWGGVVVEVDGIRHSLTTPVG